MDKPMGVQVPESLQTRHLLRMFLRIPTGESLKILLPTGESAKILQRCRVELSRNRKRFKAEGHKLRHFRLRTQVTEGFNEDYDLVEVTLAQSLTNAVAESVEDLLIRKDEK